MRNNEIEQRRCYRKGGFMTEVGLTNPVFLVGLLYTFITLGY